MEAGDGPVWRRPPCPPGAHRPSARSVAESGAGGQWISRHRGPRLHPLRQRSCDAGVDLAPPHLTRLGQFSVTSYALLWIFHGPVSPTESERKQGNYDEAQEAAFGTDRTPGEPAGSVQPRLEQVTGENDAAVGN